MLLAWTAAFAVYACAGIILALLAIRLVIVGFAKGRARLVCDAIFALLGLAILLLLF